MYKCAIIGVGPNRSRGLADAYQLIKRGQLVAVSARRRDRLDEFGDQYGVESRYTDYREMFEYERPDVVHVNTPPDVRLEVMEAAEAHGVPALIVEKPIAIQAEDARALEAFSATAKVKIALNHQLHFHPRRLELQERVKNGEIGDLRIIDASCSMNLAYQGTHALQAVGAFNPDGKPISVFGQVSGADGLAESPKKHFAPNSAAGVIAFDNGVQGFLQSGETAPEVGKDTINTHKRIAVYGTLGFVHWMMWRWEISIEGRVDSGQHDYREEDIQGQAGMTEAMFDWLEQEEAEHPLRLELGLRDFNIILGLYTSALERRVVHLPCGPPDRLIDKLRSALE